MKTAISALTLSLVLAFSVPAFASTSGAYVGDMLGAKSASQSSKSAENTAPRHHVRRHTY